MAIVHYQKRMVNLAKPSPAGAPLARSVAGLRSESTAQGHVDVLLLDGQQRQSLACCRVFGKRGLRVGVGVGESQVRFAPAFSSRWASEKWTLPDFEVDSGAYKKALLSLLKENPASVVLPAHDGSIEAIREIRSEISRLTALPLPSEAALKVAVSKERTLQLAKELGIATPSRARINTASDLRPALRSIGFPAVLKPTQSWVDNGRGGTRLTSVAVNSLKQAYFAWRYMASQGGSAEVQRWLPGRREAVSLFVSQSKVWAKFAQISHREFPVLGGVSVLCESIAMPEDIGVASEYLIQAMNLEGCSMVEFRRDASGAPVLMEVNPRMGGSVGLAVRCGVDFPGLTYAGALGERLRRTESYKVGQRVRWLSRDVWSLKASFDSQGMPDVPSRTTAVRRFFTDFVTLPAAIEPIEASDLKPALIDLKANLLIPAARRIIKTGRSLLNGT